MILPLCPVQMSPATMNLFSGKVAIVTGGASGIGRAVCEALAHRGALVTVADLDIEAAEQVADAIRGAGGEGRAARVDVAHHTEVEALVEGVAHDHGRLDYMFNNAGITVGASFAT